LTLEALNAIKTAMDDIGLEYALGRYKGNKYPYFTGEYQEIPITTEDGLEETTFILNGFSRTSILELEEAKAEIKKKFDPINGMIVTTQKGVVAIFYDSSLNIPIEDAELKRIQINLTIKEWSVN
jgi:hypothetical protein